MVVIVRGCSVATVAVVVLDVVCMAALVGSNEVSNVRGADAVVATRAATFVVRSWSVASVGVVVLVVVCLTALLVATKTP